MRDRLRDFCAIFSKVYYIIQGMASEPIITNHAYKKMGEKSVSKAEVLDTFYKGVYEKVPGGPKKMIKQYSSYEVGLFFTQDSKHGRYKITTVWRRKTLR